MAPGDIRAAFLRKPWHRFLNSSGGTIPPFAVMKVTGAARSHQDIRFTVDQPDSDQDAFYLVNGPSAVEDTLEGLCTTLTQAGYVLYDINDGTPAAGEEWGPESGSWSVHSTGVGFFIGGGPSVVDANTSAVVAIQLPGGQSTSSTELVQVWHTGSSVGDEVAANADGYHPGRVRRWVAPNMLTLQNVWIRFTDQHDRLGADFGDASMTFHGDIHGPARFSGFATSSGSTRAVYVVTHNTIQENIAFRLNEAMGESEDDTASAIVEWTNDIDAQLEDVVNIHDDLQVFSHANVVGGKGWAVRNRSLDYVSGSFEPYWQVWIVDQHHIMAHAKLYASMCHDQEEADIVEFVGDSFYPFGMTPDPLPDKAYNPLKLQGLEGFRVELKWGKVTITNEEDEEEEVEGWIIHQVQHIQAPVTANFRWDTTDGCFKWDEYEAAIMVCEEPTAKTYCPPVCDVD